GSQAVPIGHQDHGCVAMPVAAMLAGAVHQPLDLPLSEVASLNCQIYDACARFLEADFMRINFACEPPTVYVIRLSCTVGWAGSAWGSTEGGCQGGREAAAPAARVGVGGPPGGRTRENRKVLGGYT